MVQGQNVLYQVSLLQGLTNGAYYGSVTIAELKRHGDTGIGTFDALNGEVYRAAGDGRIEAVSDAETTPFAVAVFMRTDATKRFSEISAVRMHKSAFTRRERFAGVCCLGK